MKQELPRAAKIVVATLLAVIAVHELVTPIPYFWGWIAAIIAVGIFAAPWASNRPSRGEYRIALISPFAQPLLRWYLNGRRTTDNRDVTVSSFASAQTAAAISGTCDAVVVYEDEYPAARRYLPTSLKIVMTRGRTLPPSGVIVMDGVARVGRPPDLLKVLPINTFVTHPGSQRILIVALSLAVVIVIVWILYS